MPSYREQLVHQLQCEGALTEQAARELADAYTDEVLLADGQAYPGQLAMLTGLVATLNVVAKHGDLAEVRQVLAEYANDDAQAREKSTAPSGDATPALTVFRASHDSIVMGLYTTREAARKHCETLLRRDISDGVLGWVPEDGSDLAPEELSVFGPDGDEEGPEETCTGYVVTPLEVASEYDEEADE